MDHILSPIKRPPGNFILDGKFISRTLVQNSGPAERSLICGTCANMITVGNACARCCQVAKTDQKTFTSLIVETWKEGKLSVAPYLEGPERQPLPLKPRESEQTLKQQVCEHQFFWHLENGVDPDVRLRTANRRLLLSSQSNQERARNLQAQEVQIKCNAPLSVYKPLRTYGGGQDRPHHISRSKNIPTL